MRRTIGLVAAVLLFGTVAQAQVDVVAHVKGDLQLRGVSLVGTCGAFEITKRVAWELRGAGWGLIAKTDGDQCQGFSGDKLVSSTGLFVDVLVDQGGANTPSWQQRAASPAELLLRRDPFDPGDVPASLPPAPVAGPPTPAPPAGLDLTGVQAQIAGLAQQEHDDYAALLAAVNEPAWYRRIATNRYVQLVGGMLATCAVSPDCRATLFGMRSTAAKP